MIDMTVQRRCLLVFMSIAVLAASCTTTGPAGLFGKKSLHEQYGDKIKNAGLSETALGKKWFDAAEQSLASPLPVSVPYSETGYFSAEAPRAAGVVFQAKRGEKLTINVVTKPATGFAVYLDLCQPAATAEAKPVLLSSADTTTSAVTYEVDKDGKYIVRLQPELLKGGEYTLTISGGPSLAFPVTPKVKSNIESFWGAGRDANTRRHEGIDIFAPRRTALVAAADGVITRVNENKLGGKVVFLLPDHKNYTLYYAHLEEQLVQPGQTMHTGDTVGLMGNTGNAITTSPHLHFGIYTTAGAIDPLPFVNRVNTTPAKINAPAANLNKWVRNTKAASLIVAGQGAGDKLSIEANTLLKAEAATGDWYKVSLPDGSEGFIASSSVTNALQPLRKARVKNAQPLLDEPNALAAAKTTLPAGQQVGVLATYRDYYYISKVDNEEGWIPRKAL